MTKTAVDDHSIVIWEIRLFGQTGLWPPRVAMTAMVCSAVAEVSLLSGFFQHWPDAAVDPLLSFESHRRATAVQREPSVVVAVRPACKGR